MRHSFLLGLALLLVPLVALAQVYKWVDGKGTVHFSQTPPPAGVTYEVIRLSSDTTSATASSAPATEASVAPERSGSMASSLANTPANRAALCKQLRQNLALLSGNEALNMAGADGKPVALEGKRRALQKANTEAQIRQYCASPAAQ